MGPRQTQTASGVDFVLTNRHYSPTNSDITQQTPFCRGSSFGLYVFLLSILGVDAANDENKN